MTVWLNSINSIKKEDEHTYLELRRVQVKSMGGGGELPHNSDTDAHGKEIVLRGKTIKSTESKSWVEAPIQVFRSITVFPVKP